MIRINIAEAKVHLSRYLERVEAGETVLICRRNVPIAELRPLARLETRRRPHGLDRGRIVVPDDFNRPLPDADLDAWEPR